MLIHEISMLRRHYYFLLCLYSLACDTKMNVWEKDANTISEKNYYKAMREGVRRLNVAGDMGERGAAGTLPFTPTKGRGELGDVEGALFAIFSRLAFSSANLVNIYSKDMINGKVLILTVKVVIRRVTQLILHFLFMLFVLMDFFHSSSLLLIHHPQFSNSLHPVLLGVVREMPLEHNLFPPRKMPRVHSDTMVLVRSTLSDIRPISVLFSKIETGRVRDEEEGDKDTSETKGEDNPESSVSVNVVVNNSGKEGTKFTGRSGKPVCGSSDGDGENLSGQ